MDDKDWKEIEIRFKNLKPLEQWYVFQECMKAANNMGHKTTREHYEKYQALVEKLGISFHDLSRYFGFDRESLVELYMTPGMNEGNNKSLNFIPLHRIDMWAISVQYYNKVARSLSMCEMTCIAKHCLIYQVIGMFPEFTD